MFESATVKKSSGKIRARNVPPSSTETGDDGEADAVGTPAPALEATKAAAMAAARADNPIFPGPRRGRQPSIGSPNPRRLYQLSSLGSRLAGARSPPEGGAGARSPPAGRSPRRAGTPAP